MSLSRFLSNLRFRSFLQQPATGALWVVALGLLFLFGWAQSAWAQATIFVNSVTSNTGGCSLTEAIYAANFDASIALDVASNAYVSGCAPGNGADTIVLQTGQTYTFDTIVNDFNNYMGPTATPIIFTDITIQANGATLQRAVGAPKMRLFSVGTATVTVTPPAGSPFTVSGTGSLTIQNAYIKGFQIKGGNGGGGGGGGMGAGGAIYINGASLTVDNSTFDSNGAVGGDGSTLPFEAGGGGGGLSGNGAPPKATGASGGGGGGGGGSRGNGGSGAMSDISSFGGGGGGTVTGAVVPNLFGGFQMGGLSGGGDGGGSGLCTTGGNDGENGGPGGGGGGGESYRPFTPCLGGGNGGDGGYGGGGGGGGGDTGAGGKGIFGGGGGASATQGSPIGLGPSGGDGGFGGGGGAGVGGYISGGPGHGGGPSGIIGVSGNADQQHGGGGAALGGAIFGDSATITIRNSTLVNNSVYRGNSGGGNADNGADAGGAIFSFFGSLTILNSTINNNHGSGSYAGVFVDNEGGTAPTFTIRNTIVANNGTRECAFNGPVTYAGSNNLIFDDFGCGGSGLLSGVDPLLGPLQINAPGNTPTMALLPGSPAIDAGDDNNALPTDQNGVTRPQGPHSDIGAFEAPPPTADLSLTKSVSSATAQIGDTLTYTLVVNNAGPNTANSVAVSDSWPSQLTFVSCAASGGGSCAFTGSSVTASYATLTANETETITVQGTLNAGAQDNLTVINTADASAASPTDPDLSNNSGSASFTVQNNSDLYVFQSTTKLTNRQLKYTIKVKNLGKYTAKQLLLHDIVPNGSKFVSITLGPWSCSVPSVGSNGTISCSLGTEAVNATQTMIFVVKVTTPGNVLVNNTATISAATFDPNLANNTSLLSSKVGP